MVIYLDNGATTWPKPPEVIQAVNDALTIYGANPGRGAYAMALAASRQVFGVRQAIASFIGAEHMERVIFTANTTDGINLALKGILRQGDHVLYSPLEHNALWRPLSTMARDGWVEAERLPATPDGNLDLAAVEAYIRPNTKMICCLHASNVTGTILPIAQLGEIARRHQLLFLVDAAQSAGILPIDIQEMKIDLLAAPGHKSLYGPMGSGFLYVGDRAADDMVPLRQGGTGSQSHSQYQPESYPDRLECGTINLPGVLGLGGGLAYIQRVGRAQIEQKLDELTQCFLKGVTALPGVTYYGPPPGVKRSPVVTINVDGRDGGEVATILDSEYDIAVRAGFHCGPLAHDLSGSGQTGGVRFSFSSFNTMAEVEQALAALDDIRR